MNDFDIVDFLKNIDLSANLIKVDLKVTLHKDTAKEYLFMKKLITEKYGLSDDAFNAFIFNYGLFKQIELFKGAISEKIEN